MRNRNQFAAAVLLIILIATSCNFRHDRKRTVRVNTNHSSLKIEYCGNIRFNEDRTAIVRISPNGYVKYKRDGKRFFAESNEQGNIDYKLYDGKFYLDDNDENAAQLIATAIEEIARHY